MTTKIDVENVVRLKIVTKTPADDLLYREFLQWQIDADVFPTYPKTTHYQSYYQIYLPEQAQKVIEWWRSKGITIDQT